MLVYSILICSYLVLVTTFFIRLFPSSKRHSTDNINVSKAVNNTSSECNDLTFKEVGKQMKTGDLHTEEPGQISGGLALDSGDVAAKPPAPRNISDDTYPRMVRSVIGEVADVLPEH